MHRREIVLTELLLPATDTPGAKAAHMNRYIDLFLRDGDGFQRTASQQTAILQALDASHNDFFQRAKSMTAGIYYNTQIGYRELNKGGRVPSTFGCEHESHA